MAAEEVTRSLGRTTSQEFGHGVANEPDGSLRHLTLGRGKLKRVEGNVVLTQKVLDLFRQDARLLVKGQTLDAVTSGAEKSLVLGENVSEGPDHRVGPLAAPQDEDVGEPRENVFEHQVARAVHLGSLVLSLDRKVANVSVQHAQRVGNDGSVAFPALPPSGLGRSHQVGGVQAEAPGNVGPLEPPVAQDGVGVLHDVVDPGNGPHRGKSLRHPRHENLELALSLLAFLRTLPCVAPACLWFDFPPAEGLRRRVHGAATERANARAPGIYRRVPETPRNETRRLEALLYWFSFCTQLD